MLTDFASIIAENTVHMERGNSILMLKLLLFPSVNHKNKALKNGHIQIFAYNFKVFIDSVLSIFKCRYRIAAINR